MASPPHLSTRSQVAGNCCRMRLVHMEAERNQPGRNEPTRQQRACQARSMSASCPSNLVREDDNTRTLPLPLAINWGTFYLREILALVTTALLGGSIPPLKPCRFSFLSVTLLMALVLCLIWQNISALSSSQPLCSHGLILQ